MFESAIKATKEGKSFNYGELTVPPGFAPIPLNNGKPIGKADASNRQSASSSTSNKMNTSKSNLQKAATTPKEIVEEFDEDEFMRKLQENDGDDADDILAKLELENDNEMDDELHDDDDDVAIPVDLDFGDDEINKKLKSIKTNVIGAKQAVKKPSLSNLFLIHCYIIDEFSIFILVKLKF